MMTTLMMVKMNKNSLGTSLVAQGLIFHAPNARGLGWIPGQWTRSQIPQLRPSVAKQTNKKFLKKSLPSKNLNSQKN